MRGMVVGEGGRSSGVLLYLESCNSVLGHDKTLAIPCVVICSIISVCSLHKGYSLVHAGVSFLFHMPHLRPMKDFVKQIITRMLGSVCKGGHLLQSFVTLSFFIWPR